MIKHTKPNAFYDTFTRKGPGQKTTHYCSGCGHGTIHKLIAETIDELEIKDRVIFCNPVGCAVFLYYYFDTGHVQCPHGRAPAVATGIRRTLDDSIVISYQGDGDLAGIGMAEIVHAANRGEDIAVFFVNNAIYGMTGGQMAPTTLLGQKTKTTPLGRDAARDGYPVKMSELLNTLTAPVFIERCSIGNAAGVLKARKAIKKAISNQKNKKGFSFVEILSPCPINWKMNPTDSRKWLVENLEKFYEVKNFRDVNIDIKNHSRFPFMNDKGLFDLLEISAMDEKESQKQLKKIGEHKVKIAGFGGQGIISVGVLLANCGKTAGFNTTWLPSYGAEMRGGTAYSSIVISDETIGSPVVDNPDVLIAMNTPSLETFENDVEKGGIIIVNSSIVSKKVTRTDVKVYYVPTTEMANKLGLTAAAAVIILAFYAKLTSIFAIDVLKEVLPSSVKNKKYIEVNQRAAAAGETFFNENKNNGKCT
jgi:2-oxoisovalerate ferredoxin oxidoreductase beta subunit